MINKVYIITFLLFIGSFSFAQTYVSRTIKSFGAKGDGKTNDQAAFMKAAAFFNERGGQGELIINKGIYLVGLQTAATDPKHNYAYNGSDVFHVKNISNLTIKGSDGAVIKYIDSLKFGAFDPESGQSFDHGKNRFTKRKFAAIIGRCFFFEKCDNIKIKDLELDGNNKAMILGGVFGDVGRQLPHIGIHVISSQNITINNIKAHNFALDGLLINNRLDSTNNNRKPDNIFIKNSAFEYNSRQGLSWTGGNHLLAENTKFNHTGRAAFRSAPCAGVDIEPDKGMANNGKFINCEFINNAGCGLVVDHQRSRNCTFINSTFWGVTAWSIWVTAPAYTFNNCKIYGSIVHAYDSPNNNDATRYVNCLFEDKPYEGKAPHGKFLIEINKRRRVTFENCTMIAHEKKLCWLQQPSNWSAEEKFQLRNCKFIVKSSVYPDNAWVGLIRGIRYQNTSFIYESPEAKAKKYKLNSCCEPEYNIDMGGNQIIYK